MSLGGGVSSSDPFPQQPFSHVRKETYATCWLSGRWQVSVRCIAGVGFPQQTAFLLLTWLWRRNKKPEGRHESGCCQKAAPLWDPWTSTSSGK